MSKYFRFLVPATFVVLLLISATPSEAQINTEKYRKYYSDETGFIFNLATTFSAKAGNTEYTSYAGTGRVDYNGKKFDSFIVGNFEFKNTGDAKVENQGFAHLRGIMHIAERTTWETFVQRQYDEFIDLNSRSLGGTGLNYRVVRLMSEDSIKSLDINVSLGLMYEVEEYEVDEGTIDKYLWRSTNFITVDWLIRKKLNLTGVVYFQPAFHNLKNYRIASEVGFEFAIAKSLHFILDFTYRYSSIPVTNVKKYDVSIQNGLRIEIR